MIKENVLFIHVLACNLLCKNHPSSKTYFGKRASGLADRTPFLRLIGGGIWIGSVSLPGAAFPRLAVWSPDVV